MADNLTAWEAAWWAASSAERAAWRDAQAIAPTEADPVAGIAARMGAEAGLVRALLRRLLSGDLIARGFPGDGPAALADVPPPAWDRLDLDADRGIARDMGTGRAVATGLRFRVVEPEAEPPALVVEAPARVRRAGAVRAAPARARRPADAMAEARRAYLAHLDALGLDPSNPDHLPASEAAEWAGLAEAMPRKRLRAIRAAVWGDRLRVHPKRR